MTSSLKVMCEAYSVEQGGGDAIFRSAQTGRMFAESPESKDGKFYGNTTLTVGGSIVGPSLRMFNYQVDGRDASYAGDLLITVAGNVTCLGLVDSVLNDYGTTLIGDITITIGGGAQIRYLLDNVPNNSPSSWIGNTHISVSTDLTTNRFMGYVSNKLGGTVSGSLTAVVGGDLRTASMLVNSGSSMTASIAVDVGGNVLIDRNAGPSHYSSMTGFLYRFADEGAGDMYRQGSQFTGDICLSVGGSLTSNEPFLTRCAFELRLRCLEAAAAVCGQPLLTRGGPPSCQICCGGE